MNKREQLLKAMWENMDENGNFKIPAETMAKLDKWAIAVGGFYFGSGSISRMIKLVLFGEKEQQDEK